MNLVDTALLDKEDTVCPRIRITGGEGGPRRPEKPDKTQIWTLGWPR